MTVSYAYAVATSSFGCFIKLFARWRASIYKLIWCDLLVYLIMFFSISLIYQFALDDKGKVNFEHLVVYCSSAASLIPLTFVLGFYVAIIVKRWWDQYCTLPWPDPIAVYVSALMLGHDERGRVMRRTVMRYVCACSTMMFTMIAPGVKKRFPTLESLVECGLLVDNEKLIILDMHNKFPKHPKNWMPIVWAASIVMRARREGRIRDDFSMKTIIDELNKHRDMCNRLMHYDTISIPLVYTQVVTLVVYTYFLGAAVGQQWTTASLEKYKDVHIAQYVPVFLMLEFIFYMGWLKVAECLICPFGEDDDDFQLNWMIDRNLQVSYLIVDEMHHEHPDLLKDQYWADVFPSELPYPEETTITRAEPPVPSTAFLEGKQNLSDTTVRERPSSDVLQVFWRRRDSIHYSPSTVSKVTNATSETNSKKPPTDVETGVFDIKSLHTPSMDEFRYIDMHLLDIPQYESEDSVVYYDTLEHNSFREVRATDEQKTDFDLLREKRRLERLERQKQKILHTIDPVAIEVLAKGTNNKLNANYEPDDEQLEEEQQHDDENNDNEQLEEQ